jgi:hypothetical protein
MNQSRLSKKVARPERFELPTLCFEGRCSIQLSYGRETTMLPDWLFAFYAAGSEPLSPRILRTCSRP